MIQERSEFIQFLKEKAVRKGEFTLSSGQSSDHYVNCKPVTLSGEGLLYASCAMLEHVDVDNVAVAGLTLGADPLVSGAAMASAIDEVNLDALIVRKEPKGHGTKAWIEGPEHVPGCKVTVLEDVTTTGGSAITAVEKLRDVGYIVEKVVTIVDRQQGAVERMKANGLELISLFTIDELL